MGGAVTHLNHQESKSGKSSKKKKVETPKTDTAAQIIEIQHRHEIEIKKIDDRKQAREAAREAQKIATADAVVRRQEAAKQKRIEDENERIKVENEKLPRP